MARILILGGGFGGIAVAHRLRQRLSAQDEIIMVDKGDHFMVGFRKSWALVGAGTLEEGRRPIADLAHRGVQVVKGEVTAVDPQARAAEVNGSRIAADFLVVALGAELATDQIPGFEAHAHNVYSPDHISRAARALEAFSWGKLMVGIFGTPYKCPPAPFELALLIQGRLQARGVKAQIEVFSPLPMSLPILGSEGCNVIEGRLAEKGIAFYPNHVATAVEDGQVMFTTGRRAFDLLFGVPPHRAPRVVRESGLTAGGDWVRVHPRTLETDFPGVYAIGDVTAVMMANGKPLPKAGVFAQAEGEVVAERIAAHLAGAEQQAVFGGEGGCFLEVGDGEAVMVTGQFLAEPAPRVELTEASARYLQDKLAFEADRLKEWFS